LTINSVVKMDHTFKLARYCAELTFDQIPEEVVNKAKKTVLDFCGITLGARKIGASDKVVNFIRRYEQKGQSTVIGYGFKTSPPLAALAVAGDIRYA
jgi:2-methylcitrate dehydratase PrpD